MWKKMNGRRHPALSIIGWRMTRAPANGWRVLRLVASGNSACEVANAIHLRKVATTIWRIKTADALVTKLKLEYVKISFKGKD